MWVLTGVQSTRVWVSEDVLNVGDLTIWHASVVRKKMSATSVLVVIHLESVVKPSASVQIVYIIMVNLVVILM